MKFLRNLLAVLVGLFIFSAIGIFIMIGIIAASSAERQVTVSENSILHLVVKGNIAERETDDPLAELSLPGMGRIEMGLREIKRAIRDAAEDDKIKGIYLEPGFFVAGFATLEEIRQELEAFRGSGKFIVSYSEFYTEKGYYLASVSDELYLTPDYGNLEFNGLNIELTFIKKMLDKIGVEPQIFRVGEYKSAVEPFTREDMSPENEEQISAFVNSIYDRVIEQVAGSRNLDKNLVRNISDSMLVREGRHAVEYGLITRLAYEDEVQDILKTKLELGEDEEIKLIKYNHYNKANVDSDYSKNRIAVIYGTGAIIMGKGDEETIGSEKYSKLIRDAAENSRVKAIVLRINSGGGSALATDVIWNEIRNAAGKKPVIASISDIAASGGYYMAMGCDTIVASNTSIAGSIGIFSMLFNARELMEDKLGITFDNVNTGHFSDIYTLTRPLTPYEKEILQNSVEEGYRIFIEKVAEGRDMPLDDIREVATGRIWTGTQAMDLGLIDEFGTLDDAIRIAAGKADIEDYRVVDYPVKKTFFEQLMSDLNEDVQVRIMRSRLGEFYPVLEQVKDLEEYIGIQTRLPYSIEIN